MRTAKEEIEKDEMTARDRQTRPQRFQIRYVYVEEEEEEEFLYYQSPGRVMISRQSMWNEWSRPSLDLLKLSI